MSSIPYLNPGEIIDSDSWNLVFNAADAQCIQLAGGISSVLLGQQACYRTFFFFNPLDSTQYTHPVALSWFEGGYIKNPGIEVFKLSGGVPPLVEVAGGGSKAFVRNYNSSVIDGYFAGLPVVDYSDTHLVCQLQSEDGYQLAKILYPEGIYGTGPAAIGLLDVSLKVVQRVIDGHTYTASFEHNVGVADCVSPFYMIDVFINSNLTWDSSWNKYSLLRIHNCSNSAVVWSSGTGVETSINPGASRCVRMANSGWVVCGNYMHWMNNNDARLLGTTDENGVGSCVTNLGYAADTVNFLRNLNYANARYTNVAADKTYNAAAFWDMSKIYCNAYYNPVTLNEKNPPSGGYLPSLTAGAVGDLLVPRGKFIVANLPQETIFTTQTIKMPAITWSTNLPPPGAYGTTPSGITIALFSMQVNGVTWYGYTEPIVFKVNGRNVFGVSNIAVKTLGGISVPGFNITTPPYWFNWIYNETVQSGEVTAAEVIFMPSGTANLADGTEVGPFQPQSPVLVNAGDTLTLSFSYLNTSGFVEFDFNGFAGLQAQLQSVGLGWRVYEPPTGLIDVYHTTNPAQTVYEVYSSPGNTNPAYMPDIVDLSSPLMTMLTGVPAATVGPGPITDGTIVYPGFTTSPSPGQLANNPVSSLILNPLSVHRAGRYNSVNVPSTYTYYGWELTPSGYVTTGTISVVVNNATNEIDSADNSRGAWVSGSYNFFALTEPVTDITNWLLGGGCSYFTPQIQGVSLTPFGPCVIMNYVMNMNAGWTIGVFPNFNGVSYVNVTGNTVTVTVPFFLQAANGLNQTGRSTAVLTSTPWPQLNNPFGATQPSGNPVFAQNSSYNYEQSSMFWHYPRFDRRYINGRFFYYANEPLSDNWMPSYNYFGAGNSVQLSNTCQAPYELSPSASTDVPLVLSQARSGPKPGVGRLGHFRPLPDIWTNLGAWQEGGYIEFPVSKTGPTTLLYDQINYSPGTSGAVTFYGDNRTAILNDAATATPLPSALPCMIENYNALAGALNAMPQAAVVSVGGGISYQLDASTVFLVYGGSGYTVGDSLTFYTVTIKVTATGSGGVITAIAVTNNPAGTWFNCGNSTVRPGTVTGGTGTGILVDCSIGRLTSQNPLPNYNPQGVPLPTSGSSYLIQSPTVYGFSAIWPRNAFFSWFASPGAADPIGDYFKSLGLAIEDTLPDNYGTQCPSIWGNMVNNQFVATPTTTPGDVVNGFGAYFQLLASSYRYITISTAQTLYAKMCMPFTLATSFVPMAFAHTVANVEVASVSVDIYSGLIPGSAINDLDDLPSYSQINPPVLNLSNFINVAAADFYHSADGSWAAAIPVTTMTDSVKIPFPEIAFAACGLWYRYESFANMCGDPSWPLPFHWIFNGTIGASNVYAIVDWGVLNPVKRTTTGAIITSCVFVNINAQPLCVVLVPQNYAYKATSALTDYQVWGAPIAGFIGSLNYFEQGGLSTMRPSYEGYPIYDGSLVAVTSPIANGLGSSVVPYIADNSVENNPPQVTFISSTPVPPSGYESVVTCTLANAVLQWFGCDGSS